MLTHISRWSHARGNEVVPSRWQATLIGRDFGTDRISHKCSGDPPRPERIAFAAPPYWTEDACGEGAPDARGHGFGVHGQNADTLEPELVRSTEHACKG